MEDVSFSLSVLSLCIGLIVLFAIAIFARPEEGVEVVQHKEQLASVSNSTWGAEPGCVSWPCPGSCPGVVLHRTTLPGVLSHPLQGLGQEHESTALPEGPGFTVSL